MAMVKNQSFLATLLLLSQLLSVASLSDMNNYMPSPAPASPVSEGEWVLLHTSIGISAMHMQVLKNNKLIIFDRTDFGPSNISLPSNQTCRTNDEFLNPDCTAHSVLYDIASNKFRPLTIHTDTWCSSGSLDANGTLVQTGGYRDGEHVIRTFTPCDDDTCDWVETTDRLWDRRWYASNQILPDGRIIVVGGRIAFSYEFYPKNSIVGDNKSNYLRFLVQTRDPSEENNLYPFLHLLPDGNLFIFANKRSILLDYNQNRILKEYPVMPGQDKRNYPSTGSSVMLPLRFNDVNITALPEAEILICGGAPLAAYNSSDKMNVYLEASRSCGRMKVSDPDPKWVMEQMPTPRVMPDLILLPTGDVIIVNGAMNGTAGWEDAVNPVFNPVLYIPNEDPTRRFVVMTPTTIPRMYHSTATLLPDGRIIVGGSNPHVKYNFTAFPYPTDLSLEAFYPHYMAEQYEFLRPSILSAEPTVSYGGMLSITFVLPSYGQDQEIFISLVAPSFATHSFGMNQRMLVLGVESMVHLSTFAFKINAYGPTNANVAPPGYYMIFVVHAGIPSNAVWVKVQ
ncbi:galactose oxidase [Tripterygium wilfordii]|uniref:Galactose oxidase n=1 Tax=Tripterygium wilfordii TaxID=458696 RepID=A0A7J7BYA6_TRIWF|nr:aldehyde oxidase GLOX [Tripterygium wilfordii]KAF5726798.1 galactose oxidase [Tripterygium wilfordii]